MELEADSTDPVDFEDSKELEAERENRTADEMKRLRREHVELMWNMTLSMNVLYPDAWMTEADHILKNYTNIVYTYTRVRGWDADRGNNDENQWSFAGSLLYAITVITTIGAYSTHQQYVIQTPLGGCRPP